MQEMQRQKAQLREQMKLEDMKVLEYVKEKTVSLCMAIYPISMDTPENHPLYRGVLCLE